MNAALMPSAQSTLQPTQFRHLHQQLPMSRPRLLAQPTPFDQHGHQSAAPYSTNSYNGGPQNYSYNQNGSNGNDGAVSPPTGSPGQAARPSYMPAVLRRTEYPPWEEPNSKSADDTDSDLDLPKPARPISSLLSISGLSALGRLSRRATGDSASISSASGESDEDEWDLSSFPEPSAQPTRDHWKPDLESSVCDDPTCTKYFGYLTRRHHCRRCGNIFCGAHLAYQVPLDQHAQYNPRGRPSRACSFCFVEFKRWRSQAHNSQASSISLDRPTSSASQNSESSPVPVADSDRPKYQLCDLSSSGNRGWVWSTF